MSDEGNRPASIPEGDRPPEPCEGGRAQRAVLQRTSGGAKDGDAGIDSSRAGRGEGGTASRSPFPHVRGGFLKCSGTRDQALGVEETLTREKVGLAGATEFQRLAFRRRSGLEAASLLLRARGSSRAATLRSMKRRIRCWAAEAGRER